MENWKDYPLNTNYEVSDTGFVRNKNTMNVRKPRKCGKGYLRINITMNAKHSTLNIHRMVAETFLVNPENKQHINHIDNNPLNNNVNNLEWCTHQENMRHSAKQGRKGKGTLYTPEQIYAVKYLHDDLSSYEVHRLTGVKPCTVNRVRSGQQWQHI